MPAAAGSFYSAQASLTTGGTAQKAVPTAAMTTLGNPDVSGMIVKAAKANTGIVYLGGSTVTAANGYALDAGDVLVIDNCVGPGNLWFNGPTTGSIIYILMKG